DLSDANIQGITYILGTVHYALGDYRQARALQTEALGRVRSEALFERFGQGALPAVFCRSGLARSLAQLGHFADGVVYGEEAVELADRLDQPFSLVRACPGRGPVHPF